MRINKDIVTFKSNNVMFKKELSGNKNNTVRRLNSEETKEFYEAELKTVCIVNSETGESFKRIISDITEWWDIIIISWRD